jgi:hypothetical protein
MSELTLLVLRVGFLILLWFFVFVVVYSLRSDLFGQKARKMPAAANANASFPMSAPAAAPAVAPVSASARGASETAPIGQRTAHPSDMTPRRLVIISGPREGMELDLPSEQLTIGRSSESGLVIRDDYTSTHHARSLEERAIRRV